MDADEQSRGFKHDRSEKCKEVFSLLSDYLNLELPPETCAEMEAHIGASPPCVEFTESLRKTVELCHQYKPSEMPAPLGASTREQLLDAYRKMMESRKSLPA